MAPGADADSILGVIRDVDPKRFFESRLVGRMAYTLYRDAMAIVHGSRKAKPHGDATEPTDPRSAEAVLGPEDSARLADAYRRLERVNQRMPFHAAEIHLVNLTALLFSDFDFKKSMEFVINYGRDNDTTAAVTGAILGAYLGAGELPTQWVREVTAVNAELGIDLEDLAEKLTEVIWRRAQKIN